MKYRIPEQTVDVKNFEGGHSIHTERGTFIVNYETWKHVLGAVEILELVLPVVVQTNGARVLLGEKGFTWLDDSDGRKRGEFCEYGAPCEDGLGINFTLKDWEQRVTGGTVTIVKGLL